ncbi:MAG: hypothetical protein WA160_03935 [Pseudobdellovibrio sp.]
MKLKISFAILVSSIIIVSMQSRAIETPPKSNVQKIENEMILKVKLSAELAKLNDFDKMIQNAIKNGTQSLSRTPISKDTNQQATTDIAYKDARTKFEQMKSNIAKESNEKINALLIKNFSSAELKYLIDLSQNPLLKKFRLLSVSDEFLETINVPYEKVSRLIIETRSKLNEPMGKNTPKKDK